jgi:hypothetical protein
VVSPVILLSCALAALVCAGMCFLRHVRREPYAPPVVAGAKISRNKKKRGKSADNSRVPPPRNSRAVFSLPLLLGIVMSGLSVYSFVLFYNAPRTESEKVAAYLVNILNADKSVRRNPVESVPPGPKDGTRLQLSGVSELSGEELRDAGRIITALVENRLSDVQALTRSYDEKPLALAQIAACLRSLCATVNAPYVFYTHEQWLYIGQSTHAHGDYELAFSTKDEQPQVLRWTMNSFRQGDVQCEVTQEILPRMVLQRFRAGLMRSVLIKLSAQQAPAQTLR